MQIRQSKAMYNSEEKLEASPKKFNVVRPTAREALRGAVEKSKCI